MDQSVFATQLTDCAFCTCCRALKTDIFRMSLDRPDISITDRSARLRAFYARFVARRGGASSPRIERAFAAVPREPFAGPAPWLLHAAGPWPVWPPRSEYVETPDDDPAFLYQDVLIALDAAKGINIGEPSLHARCLDTLSISEGETVLQVGAGSGYYTAILAHLVGPQGCVHAYEINPGLAARAEQNLVHLPQVSVHVRSGIADGLPKSDAVYVNAGITQPSWAWMDALKPGGRLLFPLQPERYEGVLGGMLLVMKPREGGLVWPARFVARAIFIACQAPQNEEMGRALMAAFASGGWQEVRSLRLAGQPDGSCWFAGGDWWLSKTEAAEIEAH